MTTKLCFLLTEGLDLEIVKNHGLPGKKPQRQILSCAKPSNLAINRLVLGKSGFLVHFKGGTLLCLLLYYLYKL